MKCCQRSLCPDWQRVEQSEALVPCSGPESCPVPWSSWVVSLCCLPQAYPIPEEWLALEDALQWGQNVYVLFILCSCVWNAAMLFRPEGRRARDQAQSLPSSSFSPLHEKGWAWFGKQPKDSRGGAHLSRGQQSTPTDWTQCWCVYTAISTHVVWLISIHLAVHSPLSAAFQTKKRSSLLFVFCGRKEHDITE